MKRVIAAIVLAAAVHFIFGAVWFTLFMHQWLQGIRMTREQLLQAAGGREPVLQYFIAFLCSLAMANTLAWLMIRLKTVSAGAGAKLGLITGLGFAFAAMWTENAFEQRTIQSTLVSGGYPVIGMVLMGIVLGAVMARAVEAPKGNRVAA